MDSIDYNEKITNLQDELSTNDFNPIKFIDKVLPDDSSLSLVSDLTSTISLRCNSSKHNLSEQIRHNAFVINSSDTVLADTRKSISTLSSKIQFLKDEAQMTESVVQKICTDIEPLDRAKKNLTATVTALRRFQMMTTSMFELEKNINEHNYSQCAANILAMSTLVEYFKKFQKATQFQPLINKFYDLKRSLRNQVNTELDTKLFRGTADETNLPVCEVVDAFADDFREMTIDWFCEKFLSSYDDAFLNTDLSEIQNRYRWFKQRIDVYNKQYGRAFPPEWRMQYWLTLNFSRRTCNQLKEILKTKQPPAKQYLQAFEMTVKFESKMADSFSTFEIVRIDPNAPIPEFPPTAEGVREKYEYMRRRDLQIPETKRIPASVFIGSIAAAFAPYMQIYLNAERADLSKLVNSTIGTLQQDIEDDEKIIGSSKTIIMAMKRAIDKCAGFGVDSTLLELFGVLKGVFMDYVMGLTKAMPKKLSKKDNIILICSIANTTAMLLSVFDSLATKVSSLVGENLKKSVSVSDIKTSVGSELRKQVLQAVDLFVREMDPYLAAIGTNSWTGDDKMPSKLIEIFETKMIVATEWFSSENMSRFRPAIIQRCVACVREPLFRKRGLSVEAASRIFATVSELKEALAYFTQGDSSVARRRIEFDFARLESELTILCCPEAAMVVTYLGKTKEPSKDEFLTLVRLRGLSPQEEAHMVTEYAQQLPLFQSS